MDTAQGACSDAAAAERPDKDQLRDAMLQALSGKSLDDLQKITIKDLRHDVARRLDLDKKARRMLADARRIEFCELAQGVIKEVEANMPASTSRFMDCHAKRKHSIRVLCPTTCKRVCKNWRKTHCGSIDSRK